MFKHLIAIIFVVVGVTFFSSCDNTENSDAETTAETVIDTHNGATEIDVDYEKYMTTIDLNDSLGIANSLYYSNANGEAVEVLLYLDDSSEVVKMEEIMIAPETGIVNSNIFYFKDGKKYVTKQYFEETKADSSYFVELRSYYGEKEEALVTKRREAAFEEGLEMESFEIIANKECSSDRAMRVVNQEGEFETTFQGFVELEGFLFLVVGENKKEGYASSLIVQKYSPTILQLKSNEKQMIGKPLVVEFAIIDEQGQQQILLDVAIKE